MDQNEKSFRIGQRVRIIGPTVFNEVLHIGKCFVIGEKDDPGWSKTGMHKLCGYSKYNCRHIWPATSLELAEPEYVTDGQMVEIGPVKKHNHSVTSISIDELLDRLDSIEKRLQALEDNAKEGTPSEEATEQPSIGPGDFVEIVGQPGIWYSFSSLHKISDEEILIMLGWVGKA
jgi:hypothetical protein